MRPDGAGGDAAERALSNAPSRGSRSKGGGGGGLLSPRLGGIRAHEQATPRGARPRCPKLISLSSEVLPQIKEYERVSTTVVNACVGPVLARYLLRLARGFRGGYRGRR